MKLSGRFWGCDRETGKVNWQEFEITPISEEQLRLYLETIGHKAASFEVLPKYLFKIE